jgi:propanol-preferring alcohol dehydrogenase
MRVLACGVCRTDLHIAEGDLELHRPRVVPGHEVVGVVEEVGTGCSSIVPGELVGAAWLGRTCGACRYCRSGNENLCEHAIFTGWDIDGGYADAMVADEAFVYRLPDSSDPLETAPWLCAGIIGYRALRLTALPRGGRLGLYGFGGSAHLTAQVAIAEGAEVFAITRSTRARELARSLGAAWAGGADDPLDARLDAAILFAPVGELVPVVLENLVPGGTLVVAGIHLSDIPPLSYEKHLLGERRLVSATANTRSDGEELLRLANRMGLKATVTPYPMERALGALDDLKNGRLVGAAVLAF